MTLVGIYLPNGNSGGEAGFAYKLRWMEALRARAAALLEADTPLVIAGDFNVCPTDDDFAPGALPPTDALVRPESRARFRALLWLGLTDAMRALHPTGPVYTFWDYQAGAWDARSGAAHRPCAAVAHAGRAPDRGGAGPAGTRGGKSVGPRAGAGGVLNQVGGPARIRIWAGASHARGKPGHGWYGAYRQCGGTHTQTPRRSTHAPGAQSCQCGSRRT